MPELQKRSTDLLEWLDAEKGADNQLTLADGYVPTLWGGDISLFGQIQSRCQIYAHGVVALTAGVFTAAQVVAGPTGLWIYEVRNLASANAVKVSFFNTTKAMANQVLVTCEQEDLVTPGTAATAFNGFGSQQYGVANLFPRGGTIFGGTFAAPEGGVLLRANLSMSASPFPSEPIYVPPTCSVTLCGQTIATDLDFCIRIVEALRYDGRNSGDRLG